MMELFCKGCDGGSVRVSIAVRNHVTKSKVARTGFISDHKTQVHQPGELEQEFKAGTWQQ